MGRVLLLVNAWESFSKSNVLRSHRSGRCYMLIFWCQRSCIKPQRLGNVGPIKRLFGLRTACLGKCVRARLDYPTDSECYCLRRRLGYVICKVVLVSLPCMYATERNLPLQRCTETGNKDNREGVDVKTGSLKQDRVKNVFVLVRLCY